MKSIGIQFFTTIFLLFSLQIPTYAHQSKKMDKMEVYDYKKEEKDARKIARAQKIINSPFFQKVLAKVKSRMTSDKLARKTPVDTIKSGLFTLFVGFVLVSLASVVTGIFVNPTAFIALSPVAIILGLIGVCCMLAGLITVFIGLIKLSL